MSEKVLRKPAPGVVGCVQNHPETGMAGVDRRGRRKTCVVGKPRVANPGGRPGQHFEGH